jgi:hypothetical protein
MKKPQNTDFTNLEVHCFPKGLLQSITTIAANLNKTRRDFIIQEFKKIVEEHNKTKKQNY